MRKGAKQTPEAREKIALTMTGNQHRRGVTVSDETRKKMSASKTGVALSEAHKNAIREGRLRTARVV